MPTDRTIIVSGTDTNVGKTVLAALLTLALDASYWKPIQSGLAGKTDTELVREWTGLPPERFLPEAYRFKAPRSPHHAAALEGVRIETARLALPADRGPLVVEGAGGLLVPLNDAMLEIDLFRQWGVPIVLAARSGLGTINHTLLSIEAIGSRGLPLKGVVFLGEPDRDNEAAVSRFSGAPILGRVPRLERIDAAALREVYRKHFDGTAW
jgi:dethiobiotin synthetase